MIFLLLLAAYLPALAWLWFFYTRDKYEREPRQLLLNLFLLGIGATVPALALSGIVSALVASPPPPMPVPTGGAPGPVIGMVPAVVLAILAGALIQELSKLGFAWSRVRRDPNFNEPVDGMIYMVSTALGFAAALTATPVVDAAYAMTTFGGSSSDASFYGVAFTTVLGLMTALAHASFSGITGYFLAGYVLRRRSKVYVVAGVLIATGLNAAYTGAFRLSEVSATGGLLGLAPSAAALAASLAIFAYLFRASLRRSPNRRSTLLPGDRSLVP